MFSRLADLYYKSLPYLTIAKNKVSALLDVAISLKDKLSGISRFRNVYLVLGGLAVLAVLLVADPDGGLVQKLPWGGTTLATLLVLATSVLYVGVLHLSRKAELDYTDLKELFDKAKESSTGAGLAIIGVGLFSIAIAVVILAATK